MEAKIQIQNLTDDPVVYIDNDGGVERRIIFNPQQTMALPKEMVERMQYDLGGASLLKDYLSVKDEEVRAAIGVPEDQIEYDYTKDDVVRLLTDNNVDAIADALDFAPAAIVDMLAAEAVALPTNNREVMALIKEKTGKDIEAMIRNKEMYETATVSNEEEPKQKSGRRVPVKKAEQPAGRRIKTANGQEVVIPD